MSTPSDQQLLAEIGALLPSAVTPALSPSSKGNDLFEAYLFAVIIDAGESLGATVSFEDSNEVATNQLTLRTSPGRIYSTIPNYTHAVLSFTNVDPLEVHVGVFVNGRSGVPHECDVAVIDRAEAIRSRHQNVNPRSAKARFTVEAKFYTSPVGIALGREFAGLWSDLSASLSAFATNNNGENVARLLSHRCPVGSYHPGVIPNSLAADDFRGVARKVLERYLAQ